MGLSEFVKAADKAFNDTFLSPSVARRLNGEDDDRPRRYVRPRPPREYRRITPRMPKLR
jgi:hypothetical protein